MESGDDPQNFITAALSKSSRPLGEHAARLTESLQTSDAPVNGAPPPQ
jgi:hypothetical protein